MGEFKDKLQGVADKVAGSVKEGIGKATDNPELEAEGKVQQLKGKGEDIKGKVKGAINDI
ncbi:MAG: CsbD family protein [Acetobacter sp.]|uniref:CsbD family protein n=1 Tax=Acetobacter sp. TaxID=440 RepID=UPI0039ECB47D